MIKLACVAAPGELGLPLHGVRPENLAAQLDAISGAGKLATLHGFKGDAGQILLLLAEGKISGALLGLGAMPPVHGFGAAPALLPPDSTWHIAPGDYDADAAALGFVLGGYGYARFKAGPVARAKLAPKALCARARAVAEATQLARELINTPPNYLGPGELADAAMAVADLHGAGFERVTGAALAARCPALAAVGAGSARAPEMVLLEWQGSGAAAGAKLVSLCGKGVVFDTGGYDLKPSAAMLKMKKDMGGAAILLGLAYAIMALDLPIFLQLRLGCVENSISGAAMRPSDVLQTRAGLSVEVGNTDAEGRLVLCDLLAEAAAANPDWLLDAATLTGAARVALGPDLPALFCNDEAMAQAILQAGVAQDDPLWRLPLHGGYASWLDSPVADLNNVAAKPYAGAIVAALFLQRFVPKRVSWAHIDVYAWNDQARPGRPEGGEAQGLRAMLAALEGLAGTAHSASLALPHRNGN